VLPSELQDAVQSEWVLLFHAASYEYTSWRTKKTYPFEKKKLWTSKYSGTAVCRENQHPIPLEVQRNSQKRTVVDF